MLKRIIGIALLLASTVLAYPADSVSPGDERIRYTGRFDRRDPAGPRCSWSGSAVTLSFEGTGLDVRLRDSGPEDYFEVSVDDRAPTILQVGKGQERYPLAHHLGDARHTVHMVKRTEPFVGTAQFLGFDLEAGTRLVKPPPAASRRLEMVGDSISCGFGVEAPDEKATFSPRTENNCATFEALAARALNAEYTCIAWSGRKMAPDNTMMEIYDLALPPDPDSRWDFTAWTPDAVVIDLGTNDFREAAPLRGMWVHTYTAFVRQVLQRYPRAHVFCAIGSMLSDDWPPGQHALTTARDYLQEVVQTVNDPHVHFLEFAEQRASDGYGASKHPSRRTHQIMANKLVHALRQELGWK